MGRLCVNGRTTSLKAPSLLQGPSSGREVDQQVETDRRAQARGDRRDRRDADRPGDPGLNVAPFLSPART